LLTLLALGATTCLARPLHTGSSLADQAAYPANE
jgi:hypothetical protein